MSTLLLFPLVFTVLCSAEGVPSWVRGLQCGGVEFWERASALGLKEDTLRELMWELDWQTPPTQCLKGHTETWRTEGADLINFLREIVDDDVLPLGASGVHSGISQVKALDALIRADGDDAIDWVISHVRKQLSESIQSCNDEGHRQGMLEILGKTKRDEALDLLLEVQSKAFWSGEGAPEVDREPFGRWTADEVNSQTIQRIRSFALQQISKLGTERAVEILGTGESIAFDLQDMLDSAFQTAVRRYVGVYGYPEQSGGELPADKLAAIEGIYAKYGKTYEPIQYDENMIERLRSIIPHGR